MVNSLNVLTFTFNVNCNYNFYFYFPGKLSIYSCCFPNHSICSLFTVYNVFPFSSVNTMNYECNDCCVLCTCLFLSKKLK